MPDYLNLFLVFFMGGFLSLIAQILIDLTRLTPARILVAYVCSGVFLYATGAYDTLYKIFGAGVATPLVGFGAAIGRGVREAIEKNGAIGILSGGLSATATGITAALIFALFFSLFTKGGAKRM